MILEELAGHLDRMFCRELAADWDRVGLQVGSSRRQVKKILVALDADDEVIEEAVTSGVHLIIAHHPLIFDSLATVTDISPTGRRLLKLIENGVAVYSAHTNYDTMEGGLNDILAQRLGLTGVTKLAPGKVRYYKFVVFVPPGSQDEVRKVMCSRGGGRLGDYSCCTFSSRGKGTFLPGKDASPYTGQKGTLNSVEETRMECIVPEKDLHGLAEAVLEAHPYEEPAYDIYGLENSFHEGGLARLGSLETPMTFRQYANILKRSLKVDDIGWMHRGIENTGGRQVEKVAVAAGSCNSLAGELACLDCDLVITGEIDYHNAMELSQSGKIVAAAGHGSIERFAIEGITDRLNKFIDEKNLDMEAAGSRSGCWTWRYDFGR